jgi:2'-phosphotransferase
MASSAAGRSSAAADSAVVRVSKTLSYLLRHGAVKEGLPMDPGGWVPVEKLMQHPQLRHLTLATLEEVVATNSKKRFELDRSGTARSDTGAGWRIRAAQGHTLPLDDAQLLTPITSPDGFDVVVHGTTLSAWASIQKNGLNRMARQHIHFAQGLPSHEGVISGMRSSSTVLIYLDLALALQAGIPFYLSSNGVVLSPGLDGTILPRFFQRVTFPAAP